MSIKGKERFIKFYPLWSILSVILLIAIVDLQIQHWLFWIVFILLLKDIFIDLSCFKLFGPYRGSTPHWLEHGPFVVLVFATGLAGILDVGHWTIILAFVDALVDILDDANFFK